MPELSSDDPLVGQLIGERYRILSVLGDGGMGTVYLAEHVLMEKRVALKVLHPTLAVVSSVMDRFQKEAIALARIEHPNVVSATDFGKLKNGSFYLTLEYIDGQNLGELLAAQGALPVERAINIAIQIAQALAAAHSQNIVHRDLKPHNVMLTRQDGQDMIKVLDFGLAKLRSRLGDASVSMNAGKIFGTPHYMAPEQIAGAPVDGRTDLYSLGIILYEMVAGRRPFESEEVREVLALQVGTEAPPLPTHIAPELSLLIQQLLSKSPEQRPAAAEHVVAQLRSIQAPVTEFTPEHPSFLRKELTIRGRRVPMWAMAMPVVAFVLLFAAGLVFGGGSRSETKPPEKGGLAEHTTPSSPQQRHSSGPNRERWPALISDAEFGKEEAIDELLAIPQDQRTVEIWNALAQGRIRQQKPKQALELYEKAIQHHPTLKEDERIAKFVRLASSDPDTAQLAVTIAGESLGARGADVLFSVWSETKRRTRATALAERYLKTTAVEQKASKAIKLALALRRPNLTCDAIKELVEEAKEYGDTRSLRPLLKLKKNTGCGPGKNEDCYPCLRGDSSLKQATQLAGKRRAPRY